MLNNSYESYSSFGNVTYVKHEIRKCTPDDFTQTFFPITDNPKAYAKAINIGAIYCPSDPAKLKFFGNGVSNLYSYFSLNLVECSYTNASDCFDDFTRE